jgi:tol-pal system protein YbgF
MSVRRHILTSTLALALLSTAPAFAQSGNDTGSRLSRIENELQTLSRAVYKGEEPPPGAMPFTPTDATANAAMEVRLTQIENTLRDMTGKVEEQGYAVRQMQERLDRVISETDRRIAELEARAGGAAAGLPPSYGSGYAGGTNTVNGTDNRWSGGQGAPLPAAPQPLDARDMTAPSQPAPDAVIDTTMDYNAPASAADSPTAGQLGTIAQDPVTGDVTLPTASDTPASHYEQAFALLRDRHYDEAATAFESFLERYPNHELATNAKYWLGETYYVRNDFERAARIFAEAYQQAPKGPKGPDNLLKLALSLNGMGKKDEACLTLKQLNKEYGTSTSPILARAAQESTRIGCP